MSRVGNGEEKQTEQTANREKSRNKNRGTKKLEFGKQAQKK